jgi:hypothetical protein
VKFADLLAVADGRPLVETAALRRFVPDVRALSVQLDRWVKQGQLLALRRGFYLLPDLFRRSGLPLEYLANCLHRPSYVSLERALQHHDLIPEAVPVVTSVTTARPLTLETPVGIFTYRQVKPAWLTGYTEVSLGSGSALLASPEKALLDLVYLSPGPFPPERLEALRLQNLERLDPARLRALAALDPRPRLRRIADAICEHRETELRDWETS